MYLSFLVYGPNRQIFLGLTFISEAENVKKTESKTKE